MKYAILLLIMITAARAAETPIVFPDESGVINVRDYGAAPDDTTDDTAAIQKALDAFPNGNRIVYLPAGTWMVTAGARLRTTTRRGARS